MRKRISFVVLSNNSAPSKQFTVSPSLVVAILLVGIIGTSFITYDYIRLKLVSANVRTYQEVISEQTDEITHQRLQVQKFAKEINVLKKEVMGLSNFEKKIRIIANLEKSKEQEGLFGIGGSIPEDMDAKIPLAKKHNDLMREMHTQVKQLKSAAEYQEKSFESLLGNLGEKQNLLACTPAIRPVESGWLTSRFGYRISPLTNRREMHKGQDISAPKGTPIEATANGTVTFAGKQGPMGLMMVINHGHGMLTRYAHCSKLIKKPGEKVKRGDIIALVGNTGRSTGPHVHYEVHLNGIPVNPGKFILN